MGHLYVTSYIKTVLSNRKIIIPQKVFYIRQCGQIQVFQCIQKTLLASIHMLVLLYSVCVSTLVNMICAAFKGQLQSNKTLVLLDKTASTVLCYVKQTALQHAHHHQYDRSQLSNHSINYKTKPSKPLFWYFSGCLYYIVIV